jgi:UPF0755 protein
MRRLTAAVALAAAGGAWLLWSPHRGFGAEPVLVDIPRGAPTRAVARMLEDRGVVRSRWLVMAARALRPRAVLQAGEYLFDKPAGAWEVVDRLARGDVHYYNLSIPEGSNMFDIAQVVERAGLFPSHSFLAAAADSAPIRDLAPEARNLEGFLFPSTYRVTRQTTPAQLCRLMTDQFRAVWRQLSRGDPGGGAWPTVTMASLVEKETGVEAERARVASVFRNRLDRAMPLQCDPTTIYAAMLEGRWRGKIHQSDLASNHPYNTYRHSGLPPGPIANPGRASIEAALRPERSQYLYFVAKPGEREHRFSTTLADHARAVQEYRNGIQAGQPPKPAGAVAGRAKPGRG